MDQNEKTPKLIFLHIPKAGGTTFHDILKRHFTPEEIFDICVVNQKLTTKEFTDLSMEQRRKINLLTGHIDFGLHESFGNADCMYVTFLRHPVERILSLYNYVHRQPNHYLYDEVVARKMSFEAFALSDLTEEIDNGQVRQISSLHPDIGDVNEAILEKAKENIRTKFLGVGIVERYDESLILLKNKCNWEKYPVYRKLNVSENKKSEFSGASREAIEKRNRYDVELYAWATAEFEKELLQIEDFSRELEILNNCNSGFRSGYEEGLRKGRTEGFNSGYNYLMSKFIVFKLGTKIKKSFSRLTFLARSRLLAMALFPYVLDIRCYCNFEPSVWGT